MPFDFVKTQCQKDSNLNEGCLKILRGYYKEYGLKALYIGWQFKSLQYLLQSMITISTLDYLENKAKKLR
jgi:Mitochondrial carrier protein